MTPADDQAIAAAAEWRRAHANGAALRSGCTCEACLANRRAELPRAHGADGSERWAFWRALAKRVLRVVAR